MEDLTNIVTIDGPAGAGKSTVARLVAERLGYRYLDTGAMYRAATWWALKSDVDMNDAGAVVECTKSMELDMTETKGGARIHVGGQDISEEIRSPAVTESIRKLDAIPGVRSHLGGLQRDFASQGPTVAEGRDMGTVIFPKARSKFYVDASLDVRADRRTKDLARKGYHASTEKLREDMRRRDENDSSRVTAPLKVPADAVRIDTSSMTIDEVVEAIVVQAKKDLD